MWGKSVWMCKIWVRGPELAARMRAVEHPLGYSGRAFDHELLMNSGESHQPAADACGMARVRLAAVRETSRGC